jgi:hypothetical protein
MMATEAKPSRIHPFAWLIMITGLVLIILFAIVPGIRMKQNDARFAAVNQGMTAGEVEEVMGEADRSVEACEGLERFWGDEVQLRVEREDIKTVLTWRVSFGVKRFTWQVGLDADGKAVAKSRFDG